MVKHSIYVGDCHNLLEMSNKYLDCEENNTTVLSDEYCIAAIKNSYYPMQGLILSKLTECSDKISEELRYSTYTALDYIDSIYITLMRRHENPFECYNEVTEIVKTFSNILYSLSQYDIIFDDLSEFEAEVDDYFGPDFGY